ncbi:endonuclease [Winogradskyella ouciana]|uniref:T9SS type A sorting domain-containing protein n=1 Tax=Winogradskyella ouciana TaxID=2608631 RepID=A0A7K1GE93_9FLAO|nr:endonuclease [Winogradskyella ouciana]MTE27463.1 T9SS type A sorting domain-containing protein [Winogradskyella ouciana]
MKQIYFIALLFLSGIVFSQQPYYSNGQNNVDFTLTGQEMYDALQLKISNNTVGTYNYGDARDDIQIMDLDPNDATNTNVLLVYGYVDNELCLSSNDRRIRNKDDFGGNNCDYNREHVFARSNADPSMGSANNSSVGIVADPHNLRASDVQRNGNRGSKLFATGSGISSGDVGSGNWYPGDEWIGDVARIMMYMYVRYGDRCLPEYNAAGPKEGTTDMLQVLLEWNATDPVSEIENNRNNLLESTYGNRNPFIDNPYLAKVIWGGDEEPEDTWGTLSVEDVEQDTLFSLSPNPASHTVSIKLPNSIETRIEIYDVLGKRVFIRKVNESMDINISNLKSGLYIVKFIQKNRTVSKKLIKS